MLYLGTEEKFGCPPQIEVSNASMNKEQRKCNYSMTRRTLHHIYVFSWVMDDVAFTFRNQATVWRISFGRSAAVEHVV